MARNVTICASHAEGDGERVRKRRVDARRAAKEGSLGEDEAGETASVRCATTSGAHSSPGRLRASECFSIGRRHVPPRKLQRRAYAARTGSGVPARDVRYAQDGSGAYLVAVLMRRSLASAARCRKWLTRCSGRNLSLWPLPLLDRLRYATLYAVMRARAAPSFRDEPRMRTDDDPRIWGRSQ